jgi:beta-mannosidase
MKTVSAILAAAFGCAFACVAGTTPASPIARTQHLQTWQLGAHKEPHDAPSEWVPATVPGAVQLDWGLAHDYPDYTFSDHYKKYIWMEDSFWTYRTQLNFPLLKANQRLFFVCGGVDYQFDIGLGDQVIHQQEGMFTPVEIELTTLAKPGDTLWICVHPIPKSFLPDPEINDRGRQRGQANRSVKPAVSYGWDFHPRLVPLGIWKDTFLEIRPATYLKSATLDYRLSDNFDKADLSIRATVDGDPADATLAWELIDPDGNTALKHTIPAESGHSTLTITLDHPQLWWPHDQGQPSLYTSKVTLLDKNNQSVDTRQQRMGFRRVRLVNNEGTWEQPSIFPKSRSLPPSTFEINGRRIFAKGANWVSPQIFPGLLNRETYLTQLSLAKQANLNLLRCWGGAPVMKDDFFAIADELGIMLWQEFPLACNLYPDDPEYLRILDQESKSIITSLKHHPSIVLWCGGNELFNDWSRMTEQSLPLRLLDSNCFQLDPLRPYMHTSPLEGSAHGPYHFIDWSTNLESLSIYQDSDYIAYNEISLGAGLRPLELLKKFIPENELFPLTPSPAWVAHKAINPNGSRLHLAPSNIEHYFGESTSIEQLIERSQFLMNEGLRGALEEIRRKKMRTSMALIWCFNEPWPNAAGCGNIVTWYNTPMPAHHYTGLAFRPVLASARIRKIDWSPDEEMTPQLWMLSDANTAIPAGRIEAWLKIGEQETFISEWQHPELAPATNCSGPKLQVKLPPQLPERFSLVIKVPDHPEYGSTYTLLKKRSEP